MAVTTTGLALHGMDRVVTESFVKTNCRRHIPPQAGRALEILGHAIEYLTDEYVRDSKQISSHDHHVQAIQILMALNRQIYYACPLRVSFAQRLRAFFTR
jgi:hypothetical protein